MHISSLPSPYGIVSMGKAAYDFIDLLRAAKQTYWQILPINPPGYGDSPYQAFSTFAGNPYLIDLDELVKDGYLTQEELDRVDWGSRADQVDFSKMYDQRLRVLHLAWSRFHKAPTEDYAEYVREQSAWLDEYVLFMAVKAYYNDGPWTEWPLDIRMHQSEAMAHYRELLHDELDFHRFLQYCFHTQWQRLREYAHENGVLIIGDIPIYVPLDSADVWSHPENFQLTRTRRPRVVAGCPPDGFNANGQYWGNPIYDWAHMEQDGFSWWMRRLRAAGESFDVVRIDHFRGIESYWATPAVNRTARKGERVKGPGMKLVNAIRKNCPDTDFIAEDLGFLTPEVQQLVIDSGFPGMKVLEFAFDSRDTGSASDYLPHNYPVNSVAYTGTHDNETLVSWYQTITSAERVLVREYLYDYTTPETQLYKSIIALIFRSAAATCIIPMQDWLGLNNSARINKPSTVGENWRWRLKKSQLPPKLQKEICSITTRYGRMNWA